ncbi:MAG TPA: SRPBCC domain-containing protein [Xanthobacteraceae bacterium]|nr:SRPBCC domain-containing protein [Xanthobacteraceae bacterium]
MPYTFVLTAAMPASTQEIYETWLDSLGHSEMTGGEATMSDEVGAEVSAWDGYITGRNLELIPGERIVQSWRTSEFGDEHEDSIITVLLQEIDDGTLLTLEHKNVPDEQRSYEESGWQSNYFEPMAAYFAARRRKTARPVAKETTAKSARKAVAPKRRAKAKANAQTKAKRKSRGKAATKAQKRAKPRSRSSGRRKRR